MRTCAIWSFAILLVSLLTAAGCTPPEKLREAENLNRILQEEKKDLAAQNEALRSDLASCRRDVATKEDDLSRQLQIAQNLRVSLSQAQQDLAITRQKFEEAIKNRRPSDILLRPLPEKLNKALVEFASKYPDLIQYTPEQGMVKFTSDLTFPKGSVKVNPDAQDALAKLVEILQSPQAENFMVFIAGHTDDIPIKSASVKRHSPTNWYLSVHRAVAVQHVLTKTNDLDPHRVAVMGFGEYHPVAPNKPNNGGNPKNRRVELWIVPAGQFLSAEAVKIPQDTEGK